MKLYSYIAYLFLASRYISRKAGKAEGTWEPNVKTIPFLIFQILEVLRVE